MNSSNATVARIVYFLLASILTSSVLPPVYSFNRRLQSDKTSEIHFSRPKAGSLQIDLPPSDKTGNEISHARIRENYARLPLSFVLNQGQANSQVNFLLRRSDYAFFLTPTELVMTSKESRIDTKEGSNRLSRPDLQRSRKSRDAVLRMKIVGASQNSNVVGLDELPGKSNYFIGNNPKQWLTSVPNYSKVKYENVYPGVDMIYYGNGGQLEYDFILAPKVDPSAIKLEFEGAQKINISSEGDLVLHCNGREIRHLKPTIYQEINGVRQTVSGRYALKARSRVGFELDSYDASKPLVIDPTISYSTYLGGSGGDAGTGIAVDSEGNAYVTGTATSTDFPIMNAYQSGRGDVDYEDVFVTKLSPDGSTLIYSTYLGGIYGDDGYAIAVDASGNAYVTGPTGSPNYPTTSGAFRTSGGSIDGNLNDAFVTKLSTTGGLVYSTYFGGEDDDAAYSIAVDNSGSAYFSGSTKSSDLPIVSGFKSSLGGLQDAFLAKLNAMGSALLYSTYFGGSGDDETDPGIDKSNGVAVQENTDYAYISGITFADDFPTTAGSLQNEGADFVAKFDTNASGNASLIYSARLSGNLSFGGIAVNSSGNVYVITNGAAEVKKLSASGGSVIYTVPAGGTGYGLALDSGANVYITGSRDNDAFVKKMRSSDGRTLYYTTLGGGGRDTGLAVAVGCDAFYITGHTRSSNFPTTFGAFKASNTTGNVNAFVVKFSSTDRETAPDATGLGPNPVRDGEYKLPATVDPTVLGDRQTELWAHVYWPESLSGLPSPTPTPSITPLPSPVPSPSVTPRSNGRIVFGSTRTGHSQAYVMDNDGNNQTQLTNSGEDKYSLAWSPDGSKIAFESYPELGDIYIMNADGSGQLNLTNSTADDYNPVWSPDGTKIAFISDRDGNRDIFVMNADGSGQTNLTHHPDLEVNPRWSPDGTKIVFNRQDLENDNGDIYVMNADGSGLIRLTDSPGSDWIPAWSPDASRIAFQSDRDGNFDIYVMNSDGSNQTRLTTAPEFEGGVVWSPDGSRIAFYRSQIATSDIYVMNTDGSQQINLTNNPGNDRRPVWSPDGTKIAFKSDRDGNTEVYVMNADGSGQTNLTNHVADEDDFDWQSVLISATPSPVPTPSPSPLPSPIGGVIPPLTSPPANASPLIVFLHGNHGTCGRANPGGPRIDDSVDYTLNGTCPTGYEVVLNHMGYDYLARRLASWGYVVVSIDANRGITGARSPSSDPRFPPLPADDPYFIKARGRLVLRHLQQLSVWNTTGGAQNHLGVDLRGKLDFSNIGLMGHSRGGEGVRAANALYKEPGSPWAARIVTPVLIKAVFEVGPTDVMRMLNLNGYQVNGQTVQSIEAEGTKWNVLLPMCDGDVSTLEGVRPFDRILKRMSEPPTAQKSTFTVWGTNHNYFNTQWQQNDAQQGCIGAGNDALFSLTADATGSTEQQQIARAGVLAFFRANVGNIPYDTFNRNFDPRFDPPSVVTSVTRVDRGFTPSPNLAVTTVFDDFDRALGTNYCAAANQCGSNITVINDVVQDHDPSVSAAVISWTSPGAGTYFQDHGQLGVGVSSFSTYRTLDFRVSRKESELNPAGPTNFSIQLVMADGTFSDPLELCTYVDLRGPVGGYEKVFDQQGNFISWQEKNHPILQTVRIPLNNFSNANLAAVRGIRFVFDGTPSGAINLANIRLTR